MKKAVLLLTTVISALGIAMFTASCKSDDYWKDKAVGNAREYLLKNTRNLTVLQREYIRYNKPVIMAEDILGDYPDAMSNNLSTSLSQVCITWIIPGEKDAYIVFGTSGSHLVGWSPIRLIVKSFTPIDRSLLAAIGNARSYALNNLLYLDVEPRNIIRFNTPKLVKTNFIVDLNQDGTKTPEQVKAEEKALIQTSMVWQFNVAGSKVIVCGVGSEKLGDWRPIFGRQVTDAELKAHTVVPAPKPVVKPAVDKKITVPEPKMVAPITEKNVTVPAPKAAAPVAKVTAPVATTKK
ncbi:MAG: hypothetical protein WC071_04530 [Victivallaceae bacterium]